MKSVNIKPNIASSKFRVNNDMVYSLKSLKQTSSAFNKNLTISAVTKPSIDVIVDGKVKKPFKLSTLFRAPTRVGPTTYNIYNYRVFYLTPTHELNQDSVTIDEIPKTLLEFLQSLGCQAFLEILLSQNEFMLYRSADEYYFFKDSPTVSDYADENKIVIYSQINYLKQFEDENKDYLQTPEGKQNYEVLKLVFKSADKANNAI